MDKKQAFIALILILSLAVSACSADVPAASSTPSPPVIEVTPPAEIDAEQPLCEVREPEEEGEDQPGEIDEATREALNRMQPVYDSYARAMSSTGAAYADSTDDIFVWTVLNYIGANYAGLHPLAEKTDTQNVLPDSALNEFYKACFADGGEIPELPRQTFNIIYNKDAGKYFIGNIQNSDEFAQTIRYSMNEEGNMEAIIAWSSASGSNGGQINAVYVFTLAPNSDASSVEPLFDYSVTSVREGYTDTVRVNAVYDKDGKQYATVNFAENAVAAGAGSSDIELDLTGGTASVVPSELIFSGEETDLQIADNAEFKFSGLGAVFPDLNMKDAEKDSRGFFIKNAARENNGEHIVFNVNVMDGVIYGGSLY